MKEITTNNGKIYFDEFTRCYYKSENEKLKKPILRIMTNICLMLNK